LRLFIYEFGSGRAGDEMTTMHSNINRKTSIEDSFVSPEGARLVVANFMTNPSFRWPRSVAILTSIRQ
jgi:hypothetical protein